MFAKWIGNGSPLWLACVLVVTLLASGHADVVYLENGKTLRGIVQDSGGDTLIVETSGGTVTVPRDSVERIEESSPLDKQLQHAEILENRGEYVASIEHYVEAKRMADTPARKQAITGSLDRVIGRYIASLEQHNLLERGIQDIADIEEIKRLISDAGLLAKLQLARKNIDTQTAGAFYEAGKQAEREGNPRQAIEHYETLVEHFPDYPLSSNLERTITNLYVEVGVDAYQKARGPNSEAQAALERVLQADPDNAQALFYLGVMAFERGHFAQAQDYLQRVNPSRLSNMNANRLSTLRMQVDQRMQRAAATPTPQPAPPTPTPTPAPDLSSWAGFTNWVGHTSNRVTGAFTSMNLGDWLPIAMRWGAVLLGLVAAVYALWVWPNRYVHNDLPNRRVVYANWRVIVQWTGVLGALAYWIDKKKREAPRKRCPACNRSINNPEQFANYDFGICPYCQAEIKPPFTLPEVIESRALTIARSREFAADTDSQREEMINLLQMIMVYARKIRASDIHVEPEQERNLLRFRVDGVITESIPLDGALNQLLASCIKIMSNLNIAEKRLPQDGHFRHPIMGEEINVRVSTIPTRGGEKVVMRLLDQKIAQVSINSLGMTDEALENYQKAIHAPHGLILATGPTGSGKTTLHYASLQAINDGAKNIVTVEDPIEYELEGINQIQHNTKTGLTFATALRSILRQDPDVIMVGEIRDQETGSIAVNAALTGHLVFSTLHTIDTSNAISRLIDIGVEIKLVSSALRAIVAQRLVRKLCPHCKKSGAATAREIKLVGAEGRLLEGQTIQRPRGCKQCMNTGYIGRTGIYELLIPNQEVRTLIEQGASTYDIRQASRKSGMKTLREEGVLKVLAGVTSIEEVIRVTSEDSVQMDEEPAESPPAASA